MKKGDKYEQKTDEKKNTYSKNLKIYSQILKK